AEGNAESASGPWCWASGRRRWRGRSAAGILQEDGDGSQGNPGQGHGRADGRAGQDLQGTNRRAVRDEVRAEARTRAGQRQGLIAPCGNSISLACRKGARLISPVAKRHSYGPV